MKKERVLVGLSGGVDSSVAAHLLKSQGYEVIGAFIRVWHPDFIACSEAEDRLDAMRVAAHLEIPFITIDAREAYKQGVADEMINEYRAGRTPNPDVLCNKVVKFGIFEESRKKYNAHYIATGHYARIEKEGDDYFLNTAVDTSKDQSYFLSHIDHSVLSKVLFPIGAMLKSEVRAYAERAGLPSATRKDSQGICFLGKLDMRDFLSHYIEKKDGAVETLDGKVVGTHEGVLFYTLGERHGFHINPSSNDEKSFYVVAKDIPRNVLVVSHTPPEYQVGDTLTLSFWHSLVPNTTLSARIGKKLEAQVRYHGQRTPATVNILGSTARVTLENTAEKPSPGQTCVLFDGEVVLGSGIIEG